MYAIRSYYAEDGTIRRRTEHAYPQQGREMTILTFDHDIGPTATYNEGLKLVTGDYCTYVVGDDRNNFV